jgi:hypothetical protein
MDVHHHHQNSLKVDLNLDQLQRVHMFTTFSSKIIFNIIQPNISQIRFYIQSSYAFIFQAFAIVFLFVKGYFRRMEGLTINTSE